MTLIQDSRGAPFHRSAVHIHLHAKLRLCAGLDRWGPMLGRPVVPELHKEIGP